MLPLARTQSVRFGDFAFDRGTRLLRRGDQEIPLPPRVLGVLDLLLDRAGEVVPRQDIIDSVWKDAFVTDTSLAEAVSFLRQALGDDPQAPDLHPDRPPARLPLRGAGRRLDNPGRRRGRRRPRRDRQAVHPRRTRPLGLAALCAVAAVLAVWQLTHRDTPLPPVVRLRIDPPPGTALDPRGPAFAVFPDGARLGSAACGQSGCRLYLRALDRIDSTEIEGTDDAAAPFFSPDGRWIGFFGAGKLKKVALSGGAPVVLADAPQTYGAAWLPDHAIAFADSRFGGLKRVHDGGGTPAPLTEPGPGEIGHAWPAVAPGGRGILFSVATSPLEQTAGPIAVVPYEPGAANGPRTPRVIVDAAEAARPAGADYVAYTRGGDLHAMPFDRVRLAGAGTEQVIVSGIAPLQFALSDTGALVYGAAGAPGPVTIRVSGSDVGVGLGDIAGARAVALSPDGERVTIVSEDDAASDIWIKELARGAATRLTRGGVNVMPAWSPDGKTVFYASRQNGRFEIWRRDSGAATAAARLVARDSAHLFPTSVAAGTLVFTAAARGASIWAVPASGGTPSLLVDSPFDDAGGASPRTARGSPTSPTSPGAGRSISCGSRTSTGRPSPPGAARRRSGRTMAGPCSTRLART